MDYQTIRYQVEDRVATITLDRPAKMNAFTTGMMHELIDACDRIDAEGRVQPSVEDPSIKLKRTYWEANQQWPRKIRI